MGVLFTLSPDTKVIIQQAFDDLITELGKNCRIYYPARQVKCTNCVNSVQGNIWRTGGPVPFNVGSQCPVCGNKGTVAEQLTENVRLLCAIAPKDFYVPLQRSINVELPQGLVQTKSYLTDVPKLMKADFIIIETDIEGFLRQKYRPFREPQDVSNIIQGRYAVMTWQRAG